MATHASVLAWRIPETGEPGGLPSMGLQRVGHNCSDLAAAAVILNIFMCLFFLCIFSEENLCSLMSFAHFSDWIIYFLKLSFENYLLF